jgi:hypothetical protein
MMHSIYVHPPNPLAAKLQPKRLIGVIHI